MDKMYRNVKEIVASHNFPINIYLLLFHEST